MSELEYATSAGTRRGSVVALKASSAETASTTGGAVDTGTSAVNALVTVAVTAASGTTPTMTVVLEGSVDGTDWVTLGTVGANGYATGTTSTAPSNFTAAATTLAVVPAVQFIRSRSVIGGTTPSFTYSVTAQLG